MPDEPACIRAFRAAHDSAGAPGVDGGGSEKRERPRGATGERAEGARFNGARDLGPIRGRRARETSDFEKKASRIPDFGRRRTL